MTPHLTLSLSKSSIQFYQHKLVNVSNINDFKVSDMHKKKKRKKKGGILIIKHVSPLSNMPLCLLKPPLNE